MHRTTILLCGLALFTAAAPASAEPPPGALVERGLLLGFLADPTTLTVIDARSPDEYAARHVAGAVNVPADALEAHRDRLPADRRAPIVVYCATGQRAARLREALVALGYADVRVLPRRQLFWTDSMLVFNCGLDEGAPAGAASARAPSIAGISPK